jgi:peroxiredoxin
MVLKASRAAAIVLALAVSGAACAPAPRRPLDERIALTDGTGRARDLGAELAGSTALVVTFFSAHCPCQRAHDARLVALYETYHPRGVAFVAIDAEVTATRERDAEEAARRRYPFPLFTNANGSAAAAFGAEAATHTVVIDSEGRVRYAGGIDSDRSHLTGEAEPYVKDALDDVLAGRATRTPRGKVLGCALTR